MTYQLHHGDCLNIMPLIERESIDAIVTDPPYGLVEPRSLRSFGYELEHGRTDESKQLKRGGFMGKSWDHGVPGMHFWLEALRCAKPGAYLLAFGGTRTFHRLAVAIEDAGWEIRDCVMWIYGQGFPKSHDVSKALDREAGAERERNVTPNKHSTLHGDRPWMNDPDHMFESNEPATPAAAEWDGWGTALKPAWEPIIVARKPLVGTVAENVQRYGTGGMNIDGCRIETEDNNARVVKVPRFNGKQYANGTTYDPRDETGEWSSGGSPLGRWPANLIHDGSAEVLAGFPRGRSAGYYPSDSQGTGNGITYLPTKPQGQLYADTGSAARFFYCAKASKQDRDEGLEDYGSIQEFSSNPPRRNHHPTVKPTALMRYLCRLVTPPQGVILDPFMGSGSTGKAAMLEGFNFIGIDTEIEYVEIAARRIERACEKVGIVIEQPMMFETKREMADKPKQLLLL